MKIKFFFAWFDFWVGFYYDQKGRVLYVCPLPCCVFKLEAAEQKMHQTGLTAAQKEVFEKTVKECMERRQLTKRALDGAECVCENHTDNDGWRCNVCGLLSPHRQ